MMIKRECRTVSRLLWDYTLQRLAEREIDRVEMHVARCAACRRELQSTKITAGLVCSYKKDREPDSRTTWHALRAELEHAQKSAAGIPPQSVKRSAVLPVWAGTLMAGAFLATVWTAFQTSDPNAVSDTLIAKGRINTPEVTEPEVFIQHVPDSAQEPARFTGSSGPNITNVGLRSVPPSRRDTIVESPAAGTRSDSMTTRNSQRNSARKPAEKQMERSPAAEKRDSAVKQNPLPEEPQREFVMGSIPASGSRISPATYGSDSEEAPVW